MLTAQGRELIECIRFVLVGTIRSDGTPPISPVEAHIVREHLMLVMIPDTLFQLFQEAIAHPCPGLDQIGKALGKHLS
jgi:predicted pyridoxine 5'-phosphate oxidase superfamily flavin-nucleotide-binding protein